MMETEGFSFWFLHWTPTNYRASPVLRLNSEIIYWVDQKVCLGFSIKMLQETGTNFLANSLYTIIPQMDMFFLSQIQSNLSTKL